LYRLNFFSGYGLSSLKLLYNLVEPLPDDLKVVGKFKPSPLYGNDPKTKELSPCGLLFPLGQASFPAHLLL
jgi:hypothetical protein